MNKEKESSVMIKISEVKEEKQIYIFKGADAKETAMLKRARREFFKDFNEWASNRDKDRPLYPEDNRYFTTYGTCPECGLSSKIEDFFVYKKGFNEEHPVLSDIRRLNKNTYLFKCPKCEVKIHKKSNANSIPELLNSFGKLKRKAFTAVSGTEIVILKGDKISYRKYLDVKLANQYGKAPIKKFIYGFTVNTKTMMTYILPVYAQTKGKRIEGSHLINITYPKSTNCDFRVGDDILCRDVVSRKAISFIINEISKKKGLSYDVTNEEEFNFIPLFNRFGNKNNFASFASITNIIGNNRFFNSKGECPCGKKSLMYLLNAYIKEDTEKVTKWLKWQLKEDISIPKSIKKILYKNPLLVKHFIIYRAIFTDINNVKALLESMLSESDSKSIISKQSNILNNFYYIKKDSFILKYISLKGEVALKNAILKVGLNYIADACGMYSVIDKKIVIDNTLEKMLFKGNIKEIHDTISELYSEITNDTPKYIPYEEKELKRFNKKVGDYTFSLAKDTSELFDVHKEMSICVNSYSRRAVNRDLKIIVMRNKEYKSLVCLELSKESVIKQIKGYANSQARGYGKELNSYFKNTGVTVNCYQSEDETPLFEKGNVDVKKLGTEGYYSFKNLSVFKNGIPIKEINTRFSSKIVKKIKTTRKEPNPAFVFEPFA